MADTETKPTVSEKAEDTQNNEASVEKTEENDNPKVFVGNLPFKTTEEELKEAFDKFGGVVSANIITRGPRSLGYGFVEFETIESANKAIAEMHQTELKDRPINVELARARVETEKKPRKKKPRRGKGGKKGAKKAKGEEKAEGENQETKKPRKKKPKAKRPKPDLSDRTPSTTTLFVANLPFSTTDEELKEVFSDANATSAYVVRRRNNSSKGYGFVEFANEDDQKKGLEKDKSSIEEREISVKIALQQPEKEEEAKEEVKEEAKE